MAMSSFLRASGSAARAAVGLVALFGGLAAHAATQTVVLDAIAADGSSGSYPGSNYTAWSLSIASVNGDASQTSFTVAQGDTINASVVFDAPVSYAVPANANWSDLQMLLFGTGFDGSPVGSDNGTVSYSLAGSVLLTQGQGCGTSGALCDGGLYFPGGSISALTFDEYDSVFDISTLAAPVTITSGNLQAYSSLPVPEPDAQLMAMGGLLVAAVMAAHRRPS